jgi:translation initiation factor IF-2
MAEDKAIRLSKVAKEFNVGLQHVVEYLESKGIKVDSNPNAKMSNEVYSLLQEKYAPDRLAKLDAQEVTREKQKRENIVIEAKPISNDSSANEQDQDSDDVLKRSLDDIKANATGAEKKPSAKAKSEPKPVEANVEPIPSEKVIANKPVVEIAPEVTPETTASADTDVIRAKASSDSPKILGKIDLSATGPKKKGTTKAKEEQAKTAASTEKTKSDKSKTDKAKSDTKEKAEVDAKKKSEKPKGQIEAATNVDAPTPKAKDVTPKVTTKAPAEKETSVAKDTPTPNADSQKDDASGDASAPAVPPEHFGIKFEKLSGPNIIGKIDLPVPQGKKKPVASSSDFDGDKRKRKRKEKPGGPNAGGQNRTGGPGVGQGAGGQNRPGGPGGQNRPGGGPGGQNRPGGGQGGQNRPGGGPGGQNRPGGPGGNRPGGNRPGGPGGNRPGQTAGPKVEPTEKEIQDQIKATLARLSGTGKSKASKFRKEKRDLHAQRQEAMVDAQQDKVIKATEFVSANELAKMMNVPVNQIISTCMSLGLFVSINQRLDAETITVVAEEFGYTVEFVSADVQESITDLPDEPEELESRAPIVTVMGHVDHGKTSLLDYVRKANVIAGEAGGITQHIGAYEVTLEGGKKITFLDTPGHEAFTAMRARGAKVTDVAIIVVSADDSVMPQTKEAINHAQAANVPIVFAINKIDKPGANPEKIKEQLAQMNLLVEEWGGKIQSQDVSAKQGLNIEKLLEKVLLEAEFLDLKANPARLAKGTVIESSLDKGRGYVTTILVQNGTLRIGDVVLAGCHSGRVKAMFNERGGRVEVAGPSTPVMILGMSGAPQAGDQFNVMEDEREAREIANKRLQLQREQGIRTQKHITLDEIGRRLAIGNFKELNVIVKGDVDGSVEALSDSLLKLSNPEIQVNVIHKSVGQISESDILLASASNAIIIGFQVRPSVSSRRLAEQEQIDIRLYSIIYDAINEVKAAMEGMLAPEFEEKITCNVQVRETFKIPKVGTIAGCMVLDGKINRNTKIRVIRDGIVVYSGELASLKRFKDDAKEVVANMECGLNIHNFNDIRVDDIIEGYENVSVKRTLA